MKSDTRSQEQDELTQRLADCRLPEPSRELRRQVLAAARQAWSEAPVASGRWWQSPGWQLAGCVGLALLLVRGADVVSSRSLASWNQRGPAQVSVVQLPSQDGPDALADSDESDIHLLLAQRLPDDPGPGAIVRMIEYPQRLQEMLESLEQKIPETPSPAHRAPRRLSPARVAGRASWA
jgi:hypothetical protein